MVLAQSARLLSQTDTVGAKVLATIVRDYPCGKHAFTVSSVTARAVPHACSLARLAIHQIGVGAASKLGVSPDDTTHVQAARVMSFDFKDLSGGEGEYYWSVALVLSNHPFGVEVTIDKLSGAVRTSFAEGQSGRPAPFTPRPPTGRTCGVESGRLTGGRVGALYLGMPVDSVRLRCRVVRDTVEQDEGGDARYLVILVGPDTLRALVRSDRVDDILVQSSRFATADGIRVGTRLARLLSYRGLSGGAGEGEYYVDADSNPALCGLSFRLDFDGRRWPKHGPPKNLRPYASSAKIDQILVRGCHR